MKGLKWFNILLLVLVSATTQAAVKNWVASGDSYWNIDNAWSPTGVPAASDSVNVNTIAIITLRNPLGRSANTTLKHVSLKANGQTITLSGNQSFILMPNTMLLLSGTESGLPSINQNGGTLTINGIMNVPSGANPVAVWINGGEFGGDGGVITGAIDLQFGVGGSSGALGRTGILDTLVFGDGSQVSLDAPAIMNVDFFPSKTHTNSFYGVKYDSYLFQDGGFSVNGATMKIRLNDVDPSFLNVGDEFVIVTATDGAEVGFSKPFVLVDPPDLTNGKFEVNITPGVNGKVSLKVVPKEQ